MNEHNKQYQQLTQEPRYQISALRKTGMALREIAKEIGVHYSTVSRELRRNLTQTGYDPVAAHKFSDVRKRTSLKASKRNDRTDEIIRHFVILEWSPETISQRIAVECKIGEMLSHTTIYRRIEENRLQGGNLYRNLPRFGKTRWKGRKRNKKQELG